MSACRKSQVRSAVLDGRPRSARLEAYLEDRRVFARFLCHNECRRRTFSLKIKPRPLPHASPCSSCLSLHHLLRCPSSSDSRSPSALPGALTSANRCRGAARPALRRWLRPRGGEVHRPVSGPLASSPQTASPCARGNSSPHSPSPVPQFPHRQRPRPCGPTGDTPASGT